ncbi:DinB family protein [Paenibacillus sp. GP183]|jgi:hypothetical protein|uniref:DinB family protein n=1 Tax=Paenibacillus sp. GP183 TaxID=1882751 RepID=UPI0008956EF8|nr:DinB family protein [Paenibacillus sp. GP183]SEB70727.1 DinB superfamily protein [Paenibacillus sp. GP183]
MNQRPASNEYAAYHEQYVSLVPEGDLLQLMSQQIKETTDLLRNITDAQGEYRYAPGKWSLKEVIGHMSDTERIMSYRLLRFSRGDQTPLPGFEQDTYVNGAAFELHSVQDLLEELTAVRHATLYQLHGLTDEAWGRAGKFSNNDVTVKGIAYIIAGHQLHHRKIIEELYLSQL